MLPSKLLNFERKMQRNTYQMAALVPFPSAPTSAQIYMSRSPLYLKLLYKVNHFMNTQYLFMYKLVFSKKNRELFCEF